MLPPEESNNGAPISIRERILAAESMDELDGIVFELAQLSPPPQSKTLSRCKSAARKRRKELIER